ncbi:INO80 complex subunit B-like [Lampetra planeri]
MAAGAGDEGRGRGAGLSLPAPTNGRGAPPLATIAAMCRGAGTEGVRVGVAGGRGHGPEICVSRAPSEAPPDRSVRALCVAPDDSDGDPPALPDAESGPEDEEEKRWLDALERGELDDNGELKKEVDESLLTPRQRALLHRDAAPTQPLLELPMGYKEKEMTAEMLMKRAERARTRRLQAARKAEESRKQTIERLTKTGRAKSGGKAGGRVGALGRRWPMAPTVRYSSSASEGTTVSFPPGFPLPALLGPAPPPPPAPSQALDCGVPGCTNRKRYSCAKTGVPLCSLECYRKNLALQANS